MKIFIVLSFLSISFSAFATQSNTELANQLQKEHNTLCDTRYMLEQERALATDNFTINRIQNQIYKLDQKQWGFYQKLQELAQKAKKVGNSEYEAEAHSNIYDIESYQDCITNLDDQAEGFYIKIKNTKYANLLVHDRAEGIGTNCNIPMSFVDDTKDMFCILELSESDIHSMKLGLEFNAPSNFCDFVSVKTHWSHIKPIKKDMNAKIYNAIDGITQTDNILIVQDQKSTVDRPYLSVSCLNKASEVKHRIHLVLRKQL